MLILRCPVQITAWTRGCLHAILVFMSSSQFAHGAFTRNQEQGSAMTQRLGWTRDPALHLIALTTILLGAALTLSARPWRSHPSEGVDHPPGCHACSVCRPEAAAARDAFLIRTGCIEPPEI